MECKESTPSRVGPFTGIPTTGRFDSEAIIPGRCAAPPAPAMITRTPRDSASSQKRFISFGVRWADTMSVSNGTLNWSKIRAASRIPGRSESDPMSTDTNGRGCGFGDLGLMASFLGNPNIWWTWSLTSASEGPTTVIWPTLRPLGESDLPGASLLP